MNIQESGEMYLETIFILLKEGSQVRSVDIAKRMGFSKPSVSRAIGVLKNAGYLTIGEDGSVILTDDGLKTASRVYERHTILTAMLMSIGVSRETAEDDACRIEHYVSQETFDAMKAHYEKYLK